MGFLARVGTSEEELLRGLRDGREERRVWALSCYQEWLLFGVVSEWMDVCPSVFDVEGLVRTSGDGAKEGISLRVLVHMLKRFCAAHVEDGVCEEATSGWEEGLETNTNVWSSILEGLKTENSRRVFRENKNRLTSITTQAFKAAYRLHDSVAIIWKGKVDSLLDVYLQMLIASEILLETIRVVQNLLLDTTGTPISRADFPLNVMYIRWRMRQEGWCPSRIECVLAQPRGSGSVNYLLSLMPSFDSRDHVGCSIVSCGLVKPAFQGVGTDDVLPKAAIAPLKLRIQETSEAILKGHSFPVIQAKKYPWLPRFGQTKRMYWPFELVKYQPELRYVAISHVWHVPNSPTSCIHFS